MQVFEERVPCVSPRRVEANLVAVRAFRAGTADVQTMPFWRAICEIQSLEVTLRPQACPHLVWDRYEDAGVACALRDLMAVETLEAGCAYSEAEEASTRAVIANGLRALRHKFPKTFPILCETVPFVLLAKRNGYVGGSVSNRLGFIWLAPSDSWTAEDCAEHLYHEYIHQCLFLEDMVRTIFRRDTCAITEATNRTVSAIREVSRQYDQAYHSAFVAAGIVECRTRTSNISGARKLLSKLWPCLEGLLQKRELLTDNGAQQLDRLIQCVAAQGGSLGARPRPYPATKGRISKPFRQMMVL